MIRPPRLAPGARIALVAPAGPLRGQSDLDRAVENARSFGWEPMVATHALARDGYFAGPDDDRLADLDRAIRDETIDGIWCLRGGYGAMRLLDRLDFDALRRRPKPLIGFSDITALHCAIQQRCKLVSFHGPTARAELTAFSRASLSAAVVQGDDSCGVADGARTVRSGRARGRLAGGNLALLASLSGTPFAPDLAGTVLVLEDVHEAVYRIDRMLLHLRLTGALARCRALVFGAFSEIPVPAEDGTRPLDDVLDETANALGVPCVAGVPVGHIADQWTLPMGREAEVDADARAVRIVS